MNKKSQEPARNVPDFVGRLTDEQLACRNRGHGSSMKPTTVEITTNRGRIIEYRQHYRCTCGAGLIVVLDAHGEPMNSRYDYSDAPEYLAHGLGRLTHSDRNVVRLEQANRSVERRGVKTVTMTKTEAAKAAQAAKNGGNS